jgi:hypothetical protein
MQDIGVFRALPRRGVPLPPAHYRPIWSVPMDISGAVLAFWIKPEPSIEEKPPAASASAARTA